MKKRGFTLIEILVATTIVAVLSVIGIVSYNAINKRSRDAKRKSDIEQVRSALEMYRTDAGVYPGTTTGFQQLTSLDSGDGSGPLVSKYLPSIPMDPKSTGLTPATYWYDPLTSGGGTNFYAYCICGAIESDVSKNDCSTMGVTPPAALSSAYYCLKNP